MSIRLDPRRLGALKQLSAEAGLRPGELVRTWIEERLDAERRGERHAPQGPAPDVVARLDDLASRVDRLERATRDEGATATRAVEDATGAEVDGGAPDSGSAPQGDQSVEPAAAPRRARRRVSSDQETNGAQPRVALHDEIISLIAERGPMTSAELAAAITERGRYAPPRSGKPVDATQVSARVSNPTYRARFRRRDGRIELADSE